jgi:disulfide bond formation protein DsbB
MSSNGVHRPQRPQLRGYVVLMGVYSSLVGLALYAAKRAGRLGPPRPQDLVLIALATQRLSRLVSKDRVTSALRAPFTAYESEGGPGELEERPRGRGLRRAVGELLVCPFCLAQWIATALAVGLLFAPRVTRFLAGLFTVVGLADLLQLLYKGAEKATVED